jgi:hypothetical protein
MMQAGSEQPCNAGIVDQLRLTDNSFHQPRSSTMLKEEKMYCEQKPQDAKVLGIRNVKIIS